MRAQPLAPVQWPCEHPAQTSFPREKPCVPQRRGCFPWCWLTSGISLSPPTLWWEVLSSHPKWAWLDYLESSKSWTAHRKCIQLRPRIEICWELNAPACLSRNRGPRNHHCQEITQSANIIRTVSVGSPQTHHLAKIALLWRGCRKSQFGGMWETYRFGEVWTQRKI